MSNFLRDRFPLADTSTVYMDGTAAYGLVRMTKPGIIANVVMRPSEAEAFRSAVRDAMAEAWDEGYSVGRHAESGDYALYGNGDEPTNPYRATS